MTGEGKRAPSTPRSRAVTVIGTGVELLVWWALMVGVWDVTLSGTTLPDIASAAAAGLVAAVSAVAARRAMQVRGGGARPRWLLWLPVLAVAVVADTARVLVLAARHITRRDVGGELRRVSLQTPAPPGDFLHRSLATLVVSSTPGSIVVDEDPEQHEFVEHGLISGPPELEQTVAR